MGRSGVSRGMLLSCRLLSSSGLGGSGFVSGCVSLEMGDWR